MIPKNPKKWFMTVGMALAFGVVALMPSAAHADALNQMTRLTFNQPVRIPGHVTLPAGTYWFSVQDSSLATPNLIHVYDAARTHVYATFTGVTTNRADRTGRTQLVFAETSHNRPPVLVEWFYPGRSTGHELIYSPKTESRIANAERVNVVASPSSSNYAG